MFNYQTASKMLDDTPEVAERRQIAESLTLISETQIREVISTMIPHAYYLMRAILLPSREITEVNLTVGFTGGKYVGEQEVINRKLDTTRLVSKLLIDHISQVGILSYPHSFEFELDRVNRRQSKWITSIHSIDSITHNVFCAGGLIQ